MPEIIKIIITFFGTLGVLAFLFGIVYMIAEFQVRKDRKERKFNSFRARGFDPEECRDCHLPGDCPLCGAD